MYICAKIIFQDGLAGSDGLCILTSDFNHCPGARVSCLPSAASRLEASAGHDPAGPPCSEAGTREHAGQCVCSVASVLSDSL